VTHRGPFQPRTFCDSVISSPALAMGRKKKKRMIHALKLPSEARRWFSARAFRCLRGWLQGRCPPHPAVAELWMLPAVSPSQVGYPAQHIRYVSRSLSGAAPVSCLGQFLSQLSHKKPLWYQRDVSGEVQEHPAWLG